MKKDYKKLHENYKKRKQKTEDELRSVISAQSDEIFRMEDKLKKAKDVKKGRFQVSISGQTWTNISDQNAINWLKENLLGVSVDKVNNKSRVSINDQVFEYSTLREANDKAIKLISAGLWHLRVRELE